MRFSLLKKIALIKEDPAQRKLLALAAAIAAVFVLFWFVVYVPRRSQMVVLKADLGAARARFQELQELIGMGRNIGEGMRLVRELHARMEAKFPRDGATAAALLPQAAANLGIDIVSLKRGEAAAYLDAAGSRSAIATEGGMVRYVPVSLSARGYYKDIVEFIRHLRESVPGFLYVDTMRISPVAEGDARLEAVLDFKLFFLG